MWEAPRTFGRCGEVFGDAAIAAVRADRINAMAESFFAGFKREAVDGEHFATKDHVMTKDTTAAQARAAVFEWIIWYNARRLHSSLGQRPPIEYEQHLTDQLLAA